MSRRAADWAWTTPAKGNDLLVLLALADYADAEGYCWPRLEMLVDRVGLHRATVQRALAQLESMGAVEIVRGVGRHHSSKYFLQVDRDHFEDRVKPAKRSRSATLSKGEGSQAATVSEPQKVADSDLLDREKVAQSAEKVAQSARKGRTERPPKGTGHITSQEPSTGTAADAAPGTNGSHLALIPASNLPVLQAVNAGNIAKAWIDVYRREHPGTVETNQQKLQAAREARALIEAGNDPTRVMAAAEAAAVKGYSTVQKEFSFMARRNGSTNGHAVAVRPSTTNARVEAALALAQSYRDEEAL